MCVQSRILNKRILLTAGILLPLYLLQACASMSQAECEAAEWGFRGEDDGAAGLPRSTVNRHVEACAEYGITPDQVAYRAGWERGIEEYCTRDNGWQQGVNGADYQQSCPGHLQTDFYEAYQLGHNLYTQMTSAANLELELDEINEDIDDMSDEQATERRKLKKKRKRLKQDLAEAQSQVYVLRAEAQSRGFPLP